MKCCRYIRTSIHTPSIDNCCMTSQIIIRWNYLITNCMRLESIITIGWHVTTSFSGCSLCQHTRFSHMDSFILQLTNGTSAGLYSVHCSIQNILHITCTCDIIFTFSKFIVTNLFYLHLKKCSFCIATFCISCKKLFCINQEQTMGLT